MPFPNHALSRSPLDDPPLDYAAPAPGLRALTPVRGPDHQPVVSVAVDDELLWVTPVPALPVGASRPPSPGMLIHLSVQLAEDLAVAQGSALDAALFDDGLIDAAAEAVSEYLSDIPALPLIGEPFGGEEGSD